MRLWSVVACLLALLPASPVVGQNESYPRKAIRIVVPFPAGGGADVWARNVGQRLNEVWGQPVVIENRPGANGSLGAEYVARASNDGYTLLLGTVGTHAINPHLYPKLGYDPLKDFAPIIEIGKTANVLVVHPSLATKSVGELVALAKSKPDSLTYASAGSGSSQHLSAELFKNLSGASITHIPYKGAGQALPDLLSGQVSMSFTGMTSVMPYVKAGQLRALAVTTSARSSADPSLPTIAESGVPGYESVNWIGLFSPARTPPEIVGRLNGALTQILTDPKMKERLLADGYEFFENSPDSFAEHVRRELAKWGPVVQRSGARID